MNSNYIFIFIHGAMHGEWCFKKKLIPIFKKNNYRTITFDLPGSGNDYTHEENINLDNYVKKTLSVINNNIKKDEKVILVAHSLGGLTATIVAEKIPQKIHCVVYLAAFYLKKGQTIFDIPLENSFYITEDKKYLSIKEDDLVDALYNGCNNDDIEFAKSRLRNQYIGPNIEKLKVEGIIKNIEKYYIKTLNDKVIHPNIQEMMYINEIKNVVEMDTSHSPFFSKPDELFNILIKVIE